MLRLITALVLGLCVAAAQAQVQPFNAGDLVALDRVSDPRISPDGSQVVFQVRETDLEANKGINGIWIRTVDGEVEPRRLTTKGSNSFTPRWAPDGRAIFFLSTRSGSPQVWRLDLTGGEARQITELPLAVGSFAIAPSGRRLAVSIDVFTNCVADLACSKKKLDDEVASKPTGQLYDAIFVRHWDSWKDGTRTQLFALDLDANWSAGAPVLVSRGINGDVPGKPSGDDSEYTFAPDSQSMVFGARLSGRGEPLSTNFDLYRADIAGTQAPANLTASNPATDIGPLFSADGRTLYYRAMKRPGFEADRLAIMARDLSSGQSREIAPDWDRSADGLQLSRDGRTLYTTTNDLGRSPLYAIDIASGSANLVVPGGNVGAASIGPRGMVFARDNLTTPAQLYRTGLRGGAAVQLTRFNAQRLGKIAFGEAEQFTFSGAGGATVHAWLVKPANFDPAKKYPIAYLIHGGPQGSFGDLFHYRWNPQTYAGAGFAAVMVDFHGSTGYGQAFTDSISRDWGGKPMEDLRLGLDAAVAKYSFLDGDRVCALGGSYGGYMVAWLAGQMPERFRCLVNHAGVFDTRSMGSMTEELWFTEWEFGGLPSTDARLYEKWNPANHVSKWKSPMLVIHGALDYRVPYTQGIAAFTSAQVRGIESQLLFFADENHWILKPANSIQWHETVNAWLTRWLVEPPAASR